MKILLFCDDYYHPGQVPIDGTAPLKQKGYEIDVITDTADFNPAILVLYNVVIISKCDHISQTNTASWKTPEVQTAFVQYVESGGGLLVTHNGTVAGENTGILDRLIGCRFKTHPNNCPVFIGMLKPHLITEGVNLFCEIDEHYQLEILAEDIDILAASFSDKQGDESKYNSQPYFNTPASIAPSVYVRTQGKGRVCVLTPGHVTKCWLNKYFQKLLDNALRWCGGTI
jgi:type 1 glutamine amidotransferase